jgi:hypothetical protein
MRPLLPIKTIIAWSGRGVKTQLATAEAVVLHRISVGDQFLGIDHGVSALAVKVAEYCLKESDETFASGSLPSVPRRVCGGRYGCRRQFQLRFVNAFHFKTTKVIVMHSNASLGSVGRERKDVMPSAFAESQAIPMYPICENRNFGRLGR